MEVVPDSYFKKIILLIKNHLFLNGKVKQLQEIDLRLSITETQLGSHLRGKDFWLDNNVGLNGQVKRKEVFEGIVGKLTFTGIIETGTNLGNSTGYMARLTSLPVESCEIDPMRYAAAQKLLLPHFSNITLFNINSIDYLNQLIQKRSPAELLFFYLDAHWYDYLPLRKEIEIIGTHWQSAVVLIDDFKVEGDTGYGYDDYGRIGALSFAHISDLTKKFQFEAFFPKFKSDLETGAKRGYIVLAKGVPVEVLRKFDLLKTI